MDRFKRLVEHHLPKLSSDQQKIADADIFRTREWLMVARHEPLCNPHIAALRAAIELLVVPKRFVSRINKRPRKLVRL